jgi:hypothetical protein
MNLYPPKLDEIIRKMKIKRMYVIIKTPQIAVKARKIKYNKRSINLIQFGNPKKSYLLFVSHAFIVFIASSTP